MSVDYDKELLRNAVREARAGNKGAARQYFESAARTSQDQNLIADAWFGVSQMTENDGEKLKALRNCLASNPGHLLGHRALASLTDKLKNQVAAPDQPSPAPTDSQSAKVERAMCPKCGKRMSFTADGKSLVCEHCVQKEKLTSEPGKVDEKDFAVAMSISRGHSKPLNQSVFHCGDCGSQFILSPNLPSSICVYCGSARLVNGGGQPLLAPDRIVPHAFTQPHATQLLVRWVKECRIKPEKQAGQLRGIYLPLWTFNLGGLLDYTSQKSEVIPAGAKGTYIRETHLKACYPVQINDLSIPALRKLSAVFQKLTASFDFKAALPYDPRHLTNYPASVYDLPFAEASLKARAKTVSHYKRELPDRLDMKILSTSSSRVTILSFHLDLLPVWITELSLDGQKHSVLINGENGTITSDLPEKSGVMKFISGLLDG